MTHRSILWVFVTLLLNACTTYSQDRFASTLYDHLRGQDLTEGGFFVEKELGLVGEEDQLLGVVPTNLLLHLEAGLLWQTVGDFARSNDHFDAAEEFYKEDDIKGIGEETVDAIATVLGADGDYPIKPNERVLVNFYKALNYWRLQDLTSARVEFNRAFERTGVAVAYFESQIEDSIEELDEAQIEESENIATDLEQRITEGHQQLSHWAGYYKYVNPAVLFLHAMLLTKGDLADVSQAEHLLTRASGILPDNPIILRLLQKISDSSTPELGTIVIFETGVSANLNEIVTTINPLGEQKPFRIALPTLAREPLSSVTPNIMLTSSTSTSLTDDTSTDHEALALDYELLSDMNVLTLSDLQKRLPSLVAKSIAEGVIKGAGHIAAAVIESESSSLLGSAVSFLSDIVSISTTTADTRKWISTPDRWYVTAIPKSPQDVSLGVPWFSDEGVFMSNNIDVDTSKDQIIYIKQMSANSPPNITVLD